MSLLPIEMPEVNRKVCAVIKKSDTWTFSTEVNLIAVDEDDCSWRFVEDNCELSHDWDVIYWEYADS